MPVLPRRFLPAISVLPHSSRLRASGASPRSGGRAPPDAKRGEPADPGARGAACAGFSSASGRPSLTAAGEAYAQEIRDGTPADRDCHAGLPRQLRRAGRSTWQSFPRSAHGGWHRGSDVSCPPIRGHYQFVTRLPFDFRSIHRCRDPFRPPDWAGAGLAFLMRSVRARLQSGFPKRNASYAA